MARRCRAACALRGHSCAGIRELLRADDHRVRCLSLSWRVRALRKAREEGEGSGAEGDVSERVLPLQYGIDVEEPVQQRCSVHDTAHNCDIPHAKRLL
jgi:hypothetical protein